MYCDLIDDDELIQNGRPSTRVGNTSLPHLLDLLDHPDVPRSSSGAAADHSGAGRGLSGVPGLNTLSKSGTTGERAGGANNIRSSVLVGPTISVLLIMELLVLRCWCS